MREISHDRFVTSTDDARRREAGVFRFSWKWSERMKTEALHTGRESRHSEAQDMLAGRQSEIHAERNRKLETARKQRQLRRQQAA